MTAWLTMFRTDGSLLLTGLKTTLFLWLAASGLALSLGSFLGIVRSQMLRIPIVSNICDFGCFILRGVPFYVQLLIAYFVVPSLVGMNLSAIHTSWICLGVCSSAYVSQSVRAGLNSLPKNQWEACQVFGCTRLSALRVVILPQLFRTMLPTLSAECDQLLKATAIISSIGVLDLTRAGMNIISAQLNPLPVYMWVAVLYLVLSACLNLAAQFAEKKLAI